MTPTQIVTPPVTDRVRTARWAITGVFAVNGLLVPTYLVRIPSLQTALSLTESQLAAVLTCWGVAAVITMQLVGRLVARFGSARVIRLSVAALPFSLYGIAAADTIRSLAVAVAVGGAVVGTLDAAMNAHAVAVERRHSHRPRPGRLARTGHRFGPRPCLPRSPAACRRRRSKRDETAGTAERPSAVDRENGCHPPSEGRLNPAYWIGGPRLSIRRRRPPAPAPAPAERLAGRRRQRTRPGGLRSPGR